MRTDQQIVDETNELAAYLMGNLIGTGYQAPEDYKFYEASEGRSMAAWAHACTIMEMLTQTYPMDALSAVLDAEAEEADNKATDLQSRKEEAAIRFACDYGPLQAALDDKNDARAKVAGCLEKFLDQNGLTIIEKRIT